MNKFSKKIKTCNDNFYLYVVGIGNWSNIRDTTLMCENYDAVKKNIYAQTGVPYENIIVKYYDPLINVDHKPVNDDIASRTMIIIDELVIKKDNDIGITSNFVRDYVPTNASEYPKNHLVIDLANIGKYDKLNILRIGYLGDDITKYIFQQKLFEKHNNKIITIQHKLEELGFRYEVYEFYNWVARGETSSIDKNNIKSIQREFISIERTFLASKKISMKEYNLELAVELLSKIVWCDVTTNHTINMYIEQTASAMMNIMYGY